MRREEREDEIQRSILCLSVMTTWEYVCMQLSRVQHLSSLPVYDFALTVENALVFVFFPPSWTRAPRATNGDAKYFFY